MGEDAAAEEALHGALYGDRKADASLLHLFDERTPEASDDPVQVGLLGTALSVGLGRTGEHRQCQETLTCPTSRFSSNE